MIRNQADQSVTLLVINVQQNIPLTGDAANLSAFVQIDDGPLSPIASAGEEINATNAPGLYSWALSEAETNGVKLLFTGISSTASARVVPLLVYTRPADSALRTLVDGFSLDARAQLLSALAAAQDDGTLDPAVPCIPVVSGSDWRIDFTAIGDLSNRTNLIFAMKLKASDADAASLVLIDRDGLKVSNGQVPASASNGAIMVTDEVAGTGYVLVKAAATNVPAGPKRVGLKVIKTTGEVRTAELWRPCVTVLDGIVDATA